MKSRLRALACYRSDRKQGRAGEKNRGCGTELADDLLANGEANDLGRIVQVELFHDVLAVRLDGVDADRHETRNRAVGLPLGDQPEHLLLALGQEVEIVLDLTCLRLVDVGGAEQLRDRRAEERSATGNRLGGLQDVGRVLQEVAASTRLETLPDRDVVG